MENSNAEDHETDGELHIHSCFLHAISLILLYRSAFTSWDSQLVLEGSISTKFSQGVKIVYFGALIPTMVYFIIFYIMAASRPRISQGLLIASQNTTPRLTPPGSPHSLSSSVSPKRTSRPLSPRRHSISFATTRGMFDDRSSFSSMPSSHHNSMGYDTG